ncbi:unnamed protein product [Rotaria sordida]|uniref:Uncharacterized protein n=1 Tax=Rotaria sordida TaxID=392033 RepID=A0A815S6Q5_9BILA|nr:unnamed protein product [Rotaria sordida]
MTRIKLRGTDSTTSTGNLETSFINSTAALSDVLQERNKEKEKMKNGQRHSMFNMTPRRCRLLIVAVLCTILHGALVATIIMLSFTKGSTTSISTASVSTTTTTTTTSKYFSFA